MPPRSKVDQLPEGIREELNRRLIGSGFAGYEEHAAWLAEQGFEIRKSSVHRYGANFEEKCQALRRVTEQARAIVAENPDDDNAVNSALIRMAQEKAFNVLMELQLDPDTIEFPKLMRAIADMGRASVQQQKYAAEARKNALEAAAKKVDQVGKSRGISDETIDLFRREILGIADDQPARA